MNIRIPSSMTRLVEANINATVLMKCAPFWKRDLAAAKAANEQEEEMEPNKVESEILLTFPLPICWVNFFFGTKAWIIELIIYPNTKAQPDFQKNPIAVFEDSPYRSNISFIIPMIWLSLLKFYKIALGHNNFIIQVNFLNQTKHFNPFLLAFFSSYDLVFFITLNG